VILLLAVFSNSMADDEKERRQKLAFLREHYIPIVDYSLVEQSQKGMHEASKKLRVLKRILLNDNELYVVGLLHIDFVSFLFYSSFVQLNFKKINCF
jgi:hypothetical protein